eukprot:5145672-Pleurochrysis_carterae.AAC.4
MRTAPGRGCTSASATIAASCSRRGAPCDTSSSCARSHHPTPARQHRGGVCVQSNVRRAEAAQEAAIGLAREEARQLRSEPKA